MGYPPTHCRTAKKQCRLQWSPVVPEHPRDEWTQSTARAGVIPSMIRTALRLRHCGKTPGPPNSCYGRIERAGGLLDRIALEARHQQRVEDDVAHTASGITSR